jgi:general secretion pathway protein A
MYLSFYSLAKAPFGKEFKPSDSFASAAYQETMARLDYLKKTRGMGLIVGEPGAGKTFALRCFAESLNPALFKVIYFPLSTGTVMDFYRGLAIGLGEEPKFRKVDLFHQIQRAVQVSFTERKVTPVFILDEMQFATDKFLNDLSILFNFEMDTANPFILILSGLPHLLNRLSLNQNRALSQRILMRYKVEPLAKGEVGNYIEHHLQLAGANHRIFSESAVEAISSLSGGWPRLVNKLAIHSLLAGYQARKELIDETVVHLAAEEAGI